MSVSLHPFLSEAPTRAKDDTSAEVLRETLKGLRAQTESLARSGPGSAAAAEPAKKTFTIVLSATRPADAPLQAATAASLMKLASHAQVARLGLGLGLG